MQRIIAVIISLMLIGISIPLAKGDYISNPSNIPLFDNYKSPQIRPGKSGTFSFDVENRYAYPMSKVHITLEIYRYATISTTKDVVNIRNPPYILKEEQKSQNITFDFSVILPDDKERIEFIIYTEKETPQGTYFIRALLEFTYNGTEYVMKSRGHFTKEEWAIIDTPNGTLPKGVSGIIPESSFGVKEPIPQWPLYILWGGAGFLLALAVFFYVKEEKKIKSRKVR